MELLTGERAGTRAIIPRIKLTPAPSQTPFEFVRTQFPIQLAFAMTINKAQGQTFGRVGLSLIEPVFTHGQLYVAFSRVRCKQALKVKIGEGKHTKNVVYPEALQGQLKRGHQCVSSSSPLAPIQVSIVNENEVDPIGYLDLDDGTVHDFDDI